MNPRERPNGRERAERTGPGREVRHRARSELARSNADGDEVGDDVLVRPDTFIQASRDAGYSSTASAVAELIDNSVQAGAKRVEVVVHRHQEGDRAPALSVAVMDDGSGMGVEALGQALRFGGSSRFNNRDGIGRFGMGLPNASLSQARRIHVYSWSNGSGCHRVTLDLDRVVNGRALGPSVPVGESPPDWVGAPTGGHGTAVIWEECDRLPYQRAGMLARHLSCELGRIFRRSLTGGLRLLVNGARVQGSDPVRVIPAPPCAGSVVLLPPLRFDFEVAGASGRTSSVQVLFTQLPIEEWTDLSAPLKRQFGISKGAGVSVLRAGREIARGWHFMGTKRRENYDDWWRCEIAFEPVLDELFGVSHTKQGIRPTAELTQVLTPTIEAEARRLNREVRLRFERYRAGTSVAAERAAHLHHKLGAEHAVASSLADFTRGPRYQMKVGRGHGRAFAEVADVDGVLRTVLNQHHPFVRKLYEPLTRSSPKEVREAMDLWLLGMARAVAESEGPASAHVRTFLRRWSDAAALFLEER